MNPVTLKSLLGGCLLAAAAACQAQGWKPEKPVEIVVGTAAGGPQDRTGRLVQKILQERRLIDVPVTVINKPGGGGAIGLAYLNQHPGDAHYLMINAISLITNQVTGRSKTGPADFTPIAIMGIEYVGVAVRGESPLKSGGEFIERLKKDPSSLGIAIGTALGNATHVSVVHAMRKLGIDIRRMKPVVFNSGAESMTAVLGGHIDAAAAATSTLLPHVQAGRLRVLAIGAPARIGGDFAAVPTWRELGIDSAFDLWRGLAAPRGLSAAQIAWWDAALSRVTQSDDWKQDLARNQMANVYKGSAETAKHWAAEMEEVRAVFAELGLVGK